MIFKSIFNKSLKNLDEEVLTSYIVKTIVLRRFEKVNLDFDDWHNDTKIWEITDILFNDLFEAFESRSLEHYFIPSINVLKRLEENVGDSCLKRITEIRANLKTVIDIKEVIEARHFLEEIMLLLRDAILFTKVTDFTESLRDFISEDFLNIEESLQREAVLSALNDILIDEML